MRVWFNRTFSSVYAAISLIREADADGKYYLIYSNANPHVAAGMVAHEFVLEPANLDGEDYLEWCLNFCREHEVGIFIPGKAAALISSACDRFLAEGTRVLSVAKPEVLDLLHNKAEFYRTVELPCAPPAVCEPFENLMQFDAAHARLRSQFSKLCIKPSKGVYGIGFSILDEKRNCTELLLAGAQYQIGLEDFRAGLRNLESIRTMLLMEFLDGSEYSVDCVGDYGKLICAIPRKKSSKAGQGQTIDLRPDILTATEQLAALYQLNGIFNIQFRESAGELRLLEINPRMSGGIGMACIAGPNLPYIALKGFDTGFQTVAVPPVRAGIRVAELASPVELA
jgi:phosphoribosylamine-glycine ligase